MVTETILLLFYYLIFMLLAIISIGYDNIVLTAEMATTKSIVARNSSSQTSEASQAL